jgi:hypothetical protein
MDEFEFLVQETFKHHASLQQSQEPFKDNSIPSSEGLLYFVEKTSSVFVVRTFLSLNLRKDYWSVLEAPEDYPSLRLINAGLDEPQIAQHLKFFTCSKLKANKIIETFSNQRFPIKEEQVWNLSDPGLSWWALPGADSICISFKFIGDEHNAIKLGPLGNKEELIHAFQDFAHFLAILNTNLNIIIESHKLHIEGGKNFPFMDELRILIEKGIITRELEDLFLLLSKKVHHQHLETVWNKFQEYSMLRRFWLSVQV